MLDSWRGPPSFPHLHLAHFHPPMPSKVMVQVRLSRLMVAIQQVREKYDMKVLNKGGQLREGLTRSKHWL
jgi:hypothetical protein